MAAPKNNQFWKLRSTHGRELLFSSPQILWEAAKEYFEVTDKRKWTEVDFKGKDATRVEIPKDTPYTLSGLYVFLDIVETTWHNYRKKEDFVGVCTRIENIITTQKVEGALVGAYSPNLVARIEGIKDNQSLSIDTKRKEIQDLFPDELNGDNKPES